MKNRKKIKKILEFVDGLYDFPYSQKLDGGPEDGWNAAVVEIAEHIRSEFLEKEDDEIMLAQRRSPKREHDR